ncbi:MAG: L,D-transpeptidase family protein [Candidatus Liptonbacteria bacterium]|nr:L,D-transpeptidase family protein [Candidatus Liptonbacteria bacterium]
MPVSTKRHFLVVGILVTALIALLALVTVMTAWVIELRRQQITDTGKYLKGEEVVIIAPKDDQKETVVLPVTKVLFEYIEVTGGCGTNFEGRCVNVRSGPGEDYPIVTRLRNNVVLKVGGKVERDGRVWYKIVFDEWIRYPERITGDWYVIADYVNPLLDEGDRHLPYGVAGSSTKRIVVDRSKQILSAYDGEELFMETKISTGLELTPTPRGTFVIFKKTPSRYMQGPIPGISDQYYDLPGVPWNLYFTSDGAVIHGVYWHNNFGRPSSHGCVNLPPEQARKLYTWADVGTRVIVRD